MRADVDLIVVGAGIVGLGAALEAQSRGLRVAVVELAPGIIGASVRNFGHVGVAGQDGRARELALDTRERWLALARATGIWVSTAGATFVARSAEELDLLGQLAARRAGEVELAGPGLVAERTGAPASGILGGAIALNDLQVDPRSAAPGIAGWLEQAGVEFHWGRRVTRVEEGMVQTPRGDLHGDRVVVAVNHDLDQLYPRAAGEAGVVRCALDMVAIQWPAGRAPVGPVLTGSSMLRYGAFAGLPGHAALRERLAREHPELVEMDINLMSARRPMGDLVVGDTHHRGTTVSPFQNEEHFKALLAHATRLFGLDEVVVRERWQGVYASADGDYLVHRPSPSIRAVTVTTGTGMTIGLGLAAAVVGELVDH